MPPPATSRPAVDATHRALGRLVPGQLFATGSRAVDAGAAQRPPCACGVDWESRLTLRCRHNLATRLVRIRRRPPRRVQRRFRGELRHGGLRNRDAYLAESGLELVSEVTAAHFVERISRVDDDSTHAVLDDHGAAETWIERPDHDLAHSPAAPGTARARRPRESSSRVVGLGWRRFFVAWFGDSDTSRGACRLEGQLPTRGRAVRGAQLALEQLARLQQSQGTRQDPADLVGRPEGGGVHLQAFLARQPPTTGASRICMRASTAIHAGLSRSTSDLFIVTGTCGQLNLTDQPVHARMKRGSRVPEPLR
jgi:hypothetical protein